MSDKFDEMARECFRAWKEATIDATYVTVWAEPELVRAIAALVRREVEQAEKRSLDWWFAATTLRELDQRQNALTDHYYADESEEVQIYNDTAAAIRARGEQHGTGEGGGGRA